MTGKTTINTTSTVWIGTICCLLSALCYTGANICLRQLSAMQVESAWVICIKETVSVAVAGPWLLWLVLRGRIAVQWRAVGVLILAGLAVQLLGNLGMQWAFGVIGLAVCMTAVFGIMLSGSGVIGYLVFREPLPFRSTVAITMVVVSVALLSLGAAGYGRPVTAEATAVAASTSEISSPSGAPSPPNPQPVAEANVILILLGVGAACLTGLMFASLGASIRYAATLQTPIVVTVFVVTATGMIALGGLSLIRIGTSGMAATEPVAWGWMLGSGLFNLMGFALISKGLQLTTLVHANVLNASQVALGTTAGILLFHEPFNLLLLAGVCLTIGGIITFGQPGQTAEPIE